MNKAQSKSYSFLALIVALIALIATILLGITRGLVAMQVFTVAHVENLNRAILVSAGVVILGVATYAILDPDRVRRTFSGRQARYSSNAIIMIVAFLLILIFGTAIVLANPVHIADMTEDNSNTLSPELVSAVKKLPDKVTATGFFASSDRTSAEKLLSNIKSSSNGKFEYAFINPDQDPQAAMNAGITGDGKILMQMGKQKTIVALASEDEILKGLLRLLNPESSVVYFLTGHGESDTQKSGNTSMSRALSTLESKNYTVKPLNLLIDNKIPTDARVIVIAGPDKPLSDAEVKLLKDFLGKGGSLIVMENPTVLTHFGDAKDPLADMLAQDWGIKFNNNLVAFFPFTRSLDATSAPQNVALSEIVKTNERSWGETDFASLSQGGQVGLNNNEKVGPLTLAVAGENSATKGRVVVFGTSGFAVDQMFDAYGNGDMFVNSVDWTAEQESIANITPKNQTQRTFNVPSQIHWVLILLSAIFVIPGLVLLGGISTWLARRRQG